MSEKAAPNDIQPESDISPPHPGSSEKSPAAPKRNALRLIVPLILILGILGTAFWYFFLRRSATPANFITVSGRIETDDSAVAVKTSGKIREINFREGDSVKAGQVIAVLNDEQIKAREQQAQAAVRQAETQLTRAQQQISILNKQKQGAQLGAKQSGLDARGRVKQAESRVSQLQSQADQVEAQLAQAQVTLKKAEYDKERITRLYKTGDVSEEQMKQVKTNAEAQAKVVQALRKQLESVRGAVNAARGNLTIARSSLVNPKIKTLQSDTIQKQIDQAQSDIDAARANLEKAKAQLREAQENRIDLEVVAPFDGVVSTRSAEPGEFVSTGTSILTLVNPNAIYLRAFVPEGQIGKVRVGSPARIFLDSNPNQAIEAEV